MKKQIKIFVLTLLILASPFLAYGLYMNTRFYMKWYECSSKPVTIHSGYKSPKYYLESPVYEFFRPITGLYCTPLEAERAGYSANQSQYDFPHLREAGEPNPLLKRFDQPKD